MLIRQIFDDVLEKDGRRKLIRCLCAYPIENRLAGGIQLIAIRRMQFEQPVLPFGEQDARFHIRGRLEGKVRYPVYSECR